MKEQEAKQKNEAMINTARTTFPSDLDISYHLQSNLNRDNANSSFIAQSKF